MPFDQDASNSMKSNRSLRRRDGKKVFKREKLAEPTSTTNRTPRNIKEGEKPYQLAYSDLPEYSFTYLAVATIILVVLVTVVLLA